MLIEHIKGKGVGWVWGAVAALLVFTVWFSTQAFSASITVTSEPLQNTGADSRITYDQDWNAASSGSTTSVTLDVTEDLGVKADKPTTNEGAKERIEIKTESGQNKTSRIFIKFDVSSNPAGATVDSATMNVCLNQDPGHTRPYDVHQVTGTWAEMSTTWDTQPAVASTVTSTTNTVAFPGCMTWTVTSDVQAFVDGTTNNGWRIVDQDELNTTQWRVKLQAKETVESPPVPPTLDVTYTAAGMTMRHEKSTATLNGSNQVTTITLDGTKTTHSGTVNITVRLLDANGTILDTDTGSPTLPTASGTYSEVISLTLGTIPLDNLATIQVIYTAA